VKPVPTDSKTESFDYKEVLSTFRPGDIAMIKSILDGENITYFFQGENFTYLDPFVVPARLMVKKDEVEKAKELLKDFKFS
jgi:hypothetical protein